MEETLLIHEIKSSSIKRLLSFYDEFSEIHWNYCKNAIFLYTFVQKG